MPPFAKPDEEISEEKKVLNLKVGFLPIKPKLSAIKYKRKKKSKFGAGSLRTVSGADSLLKEAGYF